MGINSSALEVCIFFASMAFQNNLCLLCVVSHLKRFHKTQLVEEQRVFTSLYLLKLQDYQRRHVQTKGFCQYGDPRESSFSLLAVSNAQKTIDANFFQRVIYFLRNCWTVALGELSLYLELDVAKLISKNNLRLKRLTFMSHLSWFHEGFTIIELLLPR